MPSVIIGVVYAICTALSLYMSWNDLEEDEVSSGLIAASITL